MKHSTARNIVGGATLSLLALATTLGVAGLGVTASSPAMSQPDRPGGGSVPRLGPDQPDPTPIPSPTPVPPLPIP
jgi:hypothetical protein